MNEKIQGPILSQEEFYTLLDSENPTLLKVKELAAANDLDGAKALFARHVREGGYAEIFSQNRSIISSHSTNLSGTELLNEANRILTHELRSVGIPYKFGKEVDWFHNATYNAYPEWTWQLSRHHDIILLAKAYEDFGEEKYAECAVELLWSWIKQAVRPEPDTPDGATLCWRTIECGIRMNVWPEIFFPILKSSAVTDDFILDFCASLYEHGARLIKSKTLNNWRNIELGGFSSLAVLFPFFEESAKWREHIAKGVLDFLLCQVHPDGFQFELSTGYHHVVITTSLHAEAVLRISGYKMPEIFYETIRKMFEMYVYIMQSGGRIPDINDGRNAHIKSFMPYDSQIEESDLIKWAKSDLGRDGAPNIDTTYVFDYAGIVTMRDSWYDSKVSLLFDAGKFGRSHQHEDKLNLIVYHNAKEIITEGHNYAYDSSDMRKYVLSTFSHNTLTVDGKGQNRKKKYSWDPGMLTERENIKIASTDTVSWAKGAYTEAYGPELEITDVTHEREVAFIKHPARGDGAVIVIDTLSSENEHTYEAMWHINEDNVTLNGTVVSGTDFTVAFGADVGELRVVKGVTEPTVQGFTARSTIQNDYVAIPTVLNTLKAKKARMLTVIALGASLASASLDADTVRLKYADGLEETAVLPL